MIKKNLQYLKLFYNDLYNILEIYQTEELYKLEKINDNYNLSFQNKYIHSRYNPLNEAIRWVDSLNIREEDDCIFIIGLGLGYYLDYLVQELSNKKVIIVEPSMEVFLHFLSIRDVTSHISNKNIVFLVGKDSNTIRTLFDYYIQNNKFKSIFYSELPVYRSLYKDHIKEIYDELKKVLLLLQGNLSTEICFSRRWLYNIVRNLKYAPDHNNIACLEGYFSEIPVVIVSAGPSLEKNMNLLKDIYDRALIIAVGTAASILDSNGIKPHIIMGVDGNPSETVIFKKLKSTDPLFIYGHMIHFEAIEVYKGKKMWLHLQGEKKLEELFDSIDYTCPTIVSGGSIAHTGLAFADWLKTSTIMLIGQDLAYTNKKLYAKGSAHEDNELIKEEGYIEQEDIYGDTVYTKTPFLTFKHWFEDYIKIKIKDTKVFNCTEGGLNIKGIPNMTFQDAISKYCQRTYDINKIIDMASSKRVTVPKDLLADKIDEYREQLKDCLELSKDRLDKIAEIIEKEVYKADNFTESVDELVKLTYQMEDLEFYKAFIENTGKMYYEAINRSTHQQLAKEQDSEARRKIVLFGLLTQYSFAHDNLIVAKGAFEEKPVSGLFT